MIYIHMFMIIFLLFCVTGWSGSSADSAISAVIGDMQKVGQGKVYYLEFIKVCDASLYSSELTEAKDVLSGDVSKCLHLEYTVDIGRKDFVKVANTVLNRQFTEEQLARVDSDKQCWSTISEKNRRHFCGAYCFNGFHEDGVKSALRVCATMEVLS